MVTTSITTVNVANINNLVKSFKILFSFFDKRWKTEEKRKKVLEKKDIKVIVNDTTAMIDSMKEKVL
ncbi:hypothetical protein BDC45DRAFT_505381 [Circinella umbellata]|nr:hypothetical protein BDC45DRAFT_505381 [Circinella umbellata]